MFSSTSSVLGQPGRHGPGRQHQWQIAQPLIYALEAARERQMLTIAWAGKDGGRLPNWPITAFIVPSYSIHRIQEVHATLVHIAWDLIHIALGS